MFMYVNTFFGENGGEKCAAGSLECSVRSQPAVGKAQFTLGRSSQKRCEGFRTVVGVDRLKLKGQKY